MLGVAQPKLRRSMTASSSQNASSSGEDRVSNTAWITEDMNPGGAGKLTQRIDTFLNLEATSFKHCVGLLLSTIYSNSKLAYFHNEGSSHQKITVSSSTQDGTPVFRGQLGT